MHSVSKINTCKYKQYYPQRSCLEELSLNTFDSADYLFVCLFVCLFTLADKHMDRSGNKTEGLVWVSDQLNQSDVEFVPRYLIHNTLEHKLYFYSEKVNVRILGRTHVYPFQTVPLYATSHLLACHYAAESRSAVG